VRAVSIVPFAAMEIWSADGVAFPARTTAPSADTFVHRISVCIAGFRVPVRRGHTLRRRGRDRRDRRSGPRDLEPLRPDPTSWRSGPTPGDVAITDAPPWRSLTVQG